MDKKNETLEQRRKAQQEFLRLKKMQNGEIAPPPKPSEAAPVMTADEKKANFWYYNKGKIIFAVVAAVILSILCVQCMSRPVYDGQVVLFTYDTYYTDHELLMSDYFGLYYPDTNGDGKISVGIINCSYDKNLTVNIQQNQNAATKLSTVLLGQRETVLFVLDEESYSFLQSVSNEDQSIFKENKLYLNDAFYTVCDKIQEFPLPEGMFIAVRDYPDEDVEKDKKIKESLVAAKVFLENLETAQK